MSNENSVSFLVLFQAISGIFGEVETPRRQETKIQRDSDSLFWTVVSNLKWRRDSDPYFIYRETQRKRRDVGGEKYVGRLHLSIREPRLNVITKCEFSTTPI